MKFVRKNALVISGVFRVDDDEVAQPTSVTAVLHYENTVGVKVSTSIALDKNLDNNVWSATWDSSDCKNGHVEWMVYGSGAVVAATQGSFDIVANDANKV